MENRENEVNSIFGAMIGSLYAKIGNKLINLRILASNSNGTAKRLAAARHDTWLEARAMVEEGVYLFQELGGC